MVFSRVCKSVPWNVKYLPGEKVESGNAVFALRTPCSRICSAVLPSNSFSSAARRRSRPAWFPDCGRRFVLSNCNCDTRGFCFPALSVPCPETAFTDHQLINISGNQVSGRTQFCFAYKYSMTAHRKKTTLKKSCFPRLFSTICIKKNTLTRPSHVTGELCAAFHPAHRPERFPNMFILFLW